MEDLAIYGGSNLLHNIILCPLLVILLEHFIILKMQQKRNLKSRNNFSAFAFSEILSLSHAFAC